MNLAFQLIFKIEEKINSCWFFDVGKLQNELIKYI